MKVFEGNYLLVLGSCPNETKRHIKPSAFPILAIAFMFVVLAFIQQQQFCYNFLFVLVTSMLLATFLL